MKIQGYRRRTNRPAGVAKREAGRVPLQYRQELIKLSKSDLMEIAWEFAKRLTSEDAADLCYLEVQREHVACTRAEGRSPVKLKDF